MCEVLRLTFHFLVPACHFSCPCRRVFLGLATVVCFTLIERSGFQSVLAYRTSPGGYPVERTPDFSCQSLKLLNLEPLTITFLLTCWLTYSLSWIGWHFHALRLLIIGHGHGLQQYMLLVFALGSSGAEFIMIDDSSLGHLLKTVGWEWGLNAWAVIWADDVIWFGWWNRLGHGDRQPST